MKRAVWFLVLFSLFSPWLFNVMVSGQTGLAFLKIGVGGRAAGMAEAYTASVQDVSGCYWNPAGLGLSQKTQLMFSHNSWIQDLSHDFFAISFAKGSHHFGLALTSLNVGGIERRTIPSAEPLGKIEAHDLALGLSYARALLSSLQAGVTLKYVYERIYLESAAGFALDWGLIYQPAFSDAFQCGVVVQNLGFTTKLKNEAVPLPQTIKLGSAYRFDWTGLGSSILGAVDLVQVLNGELHVNAGLEWTLKQRLAVRGGYQTGWDAKGLHAGLGVLLNHYQFDYAYIPFARDLGNSHQFSFTLQW
ncbi:PorV/PorQ family protein [candidate division KSB1 bacterium]|nr:PorV/PorQ family protein [candidate division KSB1 bacterium]